LLFTLDGTSAFVMINMYPEPPTGGAHYGRNNKEQQYCSLIPACLEKPDNFPKSLSVKCVHYY
jgi:hypothetical protein